jgi:hypothetical protein
MAPASPQQLLHTSWTAHRLSPLFHEDYQSILGNNNALQAYAKRLKDLLTADSFGGLQVVISGNNTDNVLSKAGVLKDCRWEDISSWSWWTEYQRTIESDEEEQQLEPELLINDILGILVTLEYENAIYKAALLLDTDNADTDRRGKSANSTYLPLLLTRLPASLKQTFVNFLCSTFDAYCSTLYFPSAFLCASIEKCISAFRSLDSDTVSEMSVLERIMKEVNLTLTFAPPISPALRSIDIGLPRETMSSFNRQAAGSNLSNEANSPFLWMLANYFDNHLAMKVDLETLWGRHHQKVADEMVRLSKVACGIFILSSEGRVKLMADPLANTPITEDNMLNERSQILLGANDTLLRALLRRAVGSDLDIHEV